MKALLAIIFLFALGVAAQTPSIGIDTFAGAFTDPSAAPTGKLSLWYRRPATVWTEALPIGNGRLGAMIFGGIEGERIQFNEDTLWAGGPYDPSNPDALAALPEVRKLVFAGKYKEAEAMIQSKMMSKPIKQMPYQTIGDLRLSFPQATEVSGYRRELDIDNAIARVTYKSGGVTYSREMFASAVDDVIVIRLTANKKGSITVAAAMQTPQKGEARTEDGNTLVLDGTNGAAYAIDGRLKFQSRARFINDGGTVAASCSDAAPLFAVYSPIARNETARPTQQACVSVHNADTITILISAATSYKNYDDTSDDANAKASAAIDRALDKANVAGRYPIREILARLSRYFETLKAAHIADYQRFFRRVTLDLGSTSDLPTDERVKNFAASTDTDLAALYFQYARYLLISSSRPGTQPANLQGIWNDSTSPPWGSKYTININTEMNYWLAEPTNLTEMTEPLLGMVEEISKTGVSTAKTNYGARGWVTHHNTDLWRATGPIDSAYYGMWTTGGAWLTTHLWEHYEYSGDREFLRRAYPILKGACEFFVDFLVEDKNGFLITNPGMSPENRHQFDTSIAAGTTMDSQIIRDLFSNTIKASEVLGQDAAFAKTLKEKRDKLPPNKIGGAGQLQEWLQDWDMSAKDLRHRHVSHLYGAFPSWQINTIDTPDLANAVKKTLDTRGDDSTGWAIGWRLNLWTRLRDAERAYKILELLLRPERTYPNMFDAHPPFQIDGNFGGGNGIAEMLVQNRIKGDTVEIYLLPALPKKFANGSVNGLRARGNVNVDLTWKDGKLTSATLRSTQRTNVKVFYGTEQKSATLSPNKLWKW
ncbi:MAG TPA: glycoside hydrolase family 95 protein [Pyrinomonadaceae bacterium]|nr:glycoside hydrolase family 95 protein [Pyrinomonadaceae bacterium]